MRYPLARLFLTALVLAILHISHASAAEPDILRQMRGKSVVSTQALLVGKFKINMSNVIYFSNDGDIFYFLLKESERKIPKGSETTEGDGWKLNVYVEEDTVIIESIIGGSDSSIFTSRYHISRDSCHRSDDVYSPPGTKIPPKLVPLRCWIENGRSEFGTN